MLTCFGGPQPQAGDFFTVLTQTLEFSVKQERRHPQK
jgi:hypothetical protein